MKSSQAKKLLTWMLVLMLTILPLTGALAEMALTAGTYTATAAGFGGPIEVSVTTSADAIISVEVLSNSETAGIGSTAVERLPGAIVAAQSLKVDAVAGCTVSSTAILTAVKDALTQAGATEEMLSAEPAAAATEAAPAEAMEADVVVIGAGAAGLTAAISAVENGVKNVIVLEKMPAVGGATATAGGGMAGYKVDEDPKITQKNKEELFLYWCRTGQFTNNARLTMLAAELSTPTLDWLQGTCGVALSDSGEDGGMVNMGCVDRAAGAIKTLYEKVQQLNIPVLLDTRAEHLLTQDGRVTGVSAKGANGQALTISAKAVLLATGGYGNNPELIPDSVGNVIYYGPVCATGDGQIMAKEVGAPLFNMDKVAIKHFGIETTPGYGIHIHWAVAALFGETGSFAVSKECERVVNEGGDEYDIAYASMHKSSDGRLYIVMDQPSYDLFSGILIKYNAFTAEQLDQLIVENGSGVTKLVKNDTLAGAAEAMQLDPAALQAAADTFNAGMAAGQDAFERTSTASFGEGPYYIMQTIPRFATSLGGVNVTNDLEVLDVNEQPIPGLFAAGEVVGNVNGSYAHYLIWCFGSGMHFGDVVPAHLS
ncbi:MAG: FAD-dependent oxidoreductase [Clostridia bacterium]